MGRDGAGMVVIKPAYRDASRQKLQECGAIAVERNIGHPHAIATLCIATCQQDNVTFDAGDHPIRNMAGQPQLMCGAQAVGIAIEDKPGGHTADYRGNTAILAGPRMRWHGLCT